MNHAGMVLADLGCDLCVRSSILCPSVYMVDEMKCSQNRLLHLKRCYMCEAGLILVLLLPTQSLVTINAVNHSPTFIVKYCTKVLYDPLTPVSQVTPCAT